MKYRRCRLAAVCLLWGCLVLLPVVGSAQAESGSTEPKPDAQPAPPALVALQCPEGMVLIPSTSSVLTPSGKPLEAFCIDVFEHPNDPGEMPALNITWIEAEALCMNQGKTICTAQEWMAACSGPHGYLYPYGDTYQPETCNTEQEWLLNGSKAFPSHTYPGCVSGYGVMDMSGNVSEWVAGDGDEALIYGGSFVSGRFSSCKSYYTLPKSQRYIFNGVRCCVKSKTAEGSVKP
ncbi:MAG: SUMF1/EgtB/PvdO family nonheme iron enzyme [Candidatus Coatesbacteria bacterium]|nr:SUMF1/EgtB/PvdO family nonheme iron enzyme [Candidatus Coatesbacteria bacterium]